MVGFCGRDTTRGALAELAIDDEVARTLWRHAADAIRQLELVVLNTCNRVEVYVALPPGKTVSMFLRVLSDLQPAWRGRHASRPAHMVGIDVARHLGRVAAGLDSVIVGEREIIGQVRRAVAASRRHGALGANLDRLFAMAIGAGRRARRETDLEVGDPGLGASVVAAVRSELGMTTPTDATICVIGAGEAARSVVASLCGAKLGAVRILARHAQRGQMLASRYGCDFEPLDTLERQLRDADVIVAATDAATPIITRDQVAHAASTRKGLPVFIDVGQRPNIDTDGLARVRALESLRLDAGPRQAAVPLAERIVDVYITKCWARRNGHLLGAVLAGLSDEAQASIEERCHP